MSIGQFFYQLLIMPLELLFETVYGFAIVHGADSGTAIVIMSLVMNFLLLPLYRRADLIQDEERALEKSLENGVSHIKKTFRGDERFMILQYYYRQNGYKPYYAVKGLIPLLLEIPFFIAAYHFLSNLEELSGASFGPIRDLGAPDNLLQIAGLSISVLPLLMTLINLVSSAVYTKGLRAKDKLQLYGMAAVFLILLYRSPSGLVLYWTLNNLFSLVKNLICRMENPRPLLKGLMSAAGILLLLYGLLSLKDGRLLRASVLVLAGLLLQLPLLWPRLQTRLPRGPAIPEEEKDSGEYFRGAVFLTFLTGVLIPSAVIKSSPSEFVILSAYQSPLLHVLNAFLLAAGLFLVWLGLFRNMSDGKGKRIFDLLAWLLSGAAVTNYMFFGTDLGTLTNTLFYETGLNFTRGEKLLNLAVLAALLILLTLLWFKKNRAVKGLYTALIIAVIGMSAINLAAIGSELPDLRAAAQEMTEGEKAKFLLSQKGKNVVVIMLDRAIGSYLPWLFQEKPELQKQFEGFTYYPNTLSYGAHTHYGAPALFGGYEYTPEEINKRADELLVDKHNESLKVMPVLFDEADYEVTVCDPSLANYEWIPDLTIYEDYPDIRTWLTENGQFSYLPNNLAESKQALWKRNFFCFSVMKASPLLLQPRLYLDGMYYNPAMHLREKEGISYSRWINENYLNAAAALNALPAMMQISPGEENTFLMICNSTAHSPQLLKEPAYEPTAPVIDNRDYDREHEDRFTLHGETLTIDTQYHMMHYQTNMASLLLLGEWMDALRENGVYDNTRILIVADHGYNQNSFARMMYGEDEEDDAMFYNPLLLVKDFDSREFSTDARFMTNADTPLLAMEGLIEDPVNPFTGNAITDDLKQAEEQHVFTSHLYNDVTDTQTVFLPDSWYAVQGDVTDGSNWRLIQKSAVLP